MKLIIEIKEKSVNERKSIEEIDVPHSVIEIPEMNDTFCIILRTDENVIDFVEAITEIKKIKIIGAFNIDGSLYQFKKWEDSGEVDDEDNPIMILVDDNDSSKKYSKTKYKSQLKNKIVRDNNGDIIEDRPYTDEEAQNLQVATVYGWNKMNL